MQRGRNHDANRQSSAFCEDADEEEDLLRFAAPLTGYGLMHASMYNNLET